MGAMSNSLRSFLLLELGKGLFLTLKYLHRMCLFHILQQHLQNLKRKLQVVLNLYFHNHI